MISLKKNFVYNLLLGLSNILFPFITAPYIARVLSPEGVGLFNFANTYSSYFSIVALLGVPTYGIREIAKVRHDKVETNKILSELVTLTIITTLIASIVYILSILFIEQLNNDLIIFAIIGFVLYLAPFNINWFFSGFEDFGYIAARSIIIKTISLVSIFVFVHTPDDLLIYVVISVFANVANNIWNVFKLYRSGYSIRLSFSGIKKHVRPNMILLASSIAMTLYTILDTIMLGVMSSYTEVAFYNFASQISRAFIVVVTSLSAVTLPRISNVTSDGNYDEANALINKSYSFVLFLVIPISVSTLLLSHDFVPLFLGNQYDGVILPLQIMAGMAIAIGINNLIGTQGLIGLGNDKYFLRSVIWGATSNLILNIILIPPYGAVGASISSLVAESIVAIAMIFYMYKVTPIRLSTFCELKSIAVSSFLLVPLYFIITQLINGWLLVIGYTIFAVFIYMTAQYLLENTNVDIIISIVNNNYKKIKV